MKKLFILFCLIVGSSSLKAGHNGLYAHFSMHTQNFKSKSFSQFLESYTALNKNLLENGKVNQGLGTGWSLGVGSCAGNIIVGVEINRSRQAYTGKFLNSNVRNFSTHKNLFSFLLGGVIGEPGENKLLVIPDLVAGLGSAYIRTDFEVNNGTNTTSALKGKYKTFHGNIAPGLSLAYSFGEVSLKAGARYNVPLFPTFLQNKDYEYGFDRIPQDYSTWVINPGNYMGEEVKDDFKFWQYSIGVAIIVLQ